MKKESVFAYLVRFAVCNLLALLIYEGLFQVLNLLTGGAVAIYTGIMISSGYTPDDLSPTMKVFVPIILIVLAISVFFLFYFMMFMSVKRTKKLRGEFLRSIGAEPFNRKEYARNFLRNGYGKRELICFSVLTLICALSTYFYIPVLSFLSQPQSILTYYILTLLIIIGIPLRSVFIPAFIMIVVNLAAYYAYLTLVVPRIYEKWASERLRIEHTENAEN